MCGQIRVGCPKDKMFGGRLLAFSPGEILALPHTPSLRAATLLSP